MTVPVPPRLRARTLEAPPQPDLFDLVPPDVDPATVVSWVREGEGLIGWGRAAASNPAVSMPGATDSPAVTSGAEATGTTTAGTSGAERFSAAAQWWSAVVAATDVIDEVRLPGTGLVAFGSFSFSPDSPDVGGLVIPRVVAGQRDGRAWITSIEVIDDPQLPAAPSRGESSRALASPDFPTTEAGQVPAPPTTEAGQAPAPPTTEAGDGGEPASGIQLQSGAVPADQWPAVIASAIERISAGEVDKVVLARDVLATAPEPIDTVALLRRLAGRYGATWTFAVNGLVGATPEMLVRLQGGRVRSRVLAGTVRRDRSPAPSVTEAHPDLEAAHTPDPRLHLVSDAKELEEHEFAVRSVAEALAPHCTNLDVPTEPFVLELPDVYHLATDLSGEAADHATSLDLAAALHPSAAVCGTPSEAAAQVIAELEGMDRGRYAGPVGWLDASGDGDWGIALRCGQLAPDSHSMRLFAGGGIVAASDPQAELAETEVKLAAMRHALGLGS